MTNAVINVMHTHTDTPKRAQNKTPEGNDDNERWGRQKDATV